MPFQDGDLIEFDYELWVEGRDQLYDTTLREAAEKAGILESNAYYAPLTYVVGSGRIVPGLEKALEVAIIGQTTEVDLAPEEAYGAREAKHIETIPLQEFKKNDVAPQVGLSIRYKNRQGIVQLIGGGRVRVDFNPPLAGKRLKYRFTVNKVASSDADKVAGLIRMNFPANLEWKVAVAKTDGKQVATVEVPEAATVHDGWPRARLRAVVDVHRYTKLDRVRFLETFELPARAEPAAREVEKAA